MGQKPKTKEQLHAELDDLRQAYEALLRTRQREKSAGKIPEEALPQAYRRDHFLLNHLQAGIVVHAPDTSIINANPIACNMLGLPLEKLKGMTADDPVWHFVDEHGKKLPSDGYPVQRICAGEKQVNNQVLGVCQDETSDVVWVSVNAFRLLDETGKVLEIVTSFIDISAQKKQEYALKQSEERFKKMFERHSAIMLLIDPETGDIINGNDAALSYYGYSREQMLQRNICDINLLDDKQVKEMLRRALKGIEDTFIFPHRLVTGEKRMVEVHSAPIDFHGKIILYSIIHDITDRWENEALLHQKNTEIEAQNEEFLQTNEELSQTNQALVAAVHRYEISEERFRLAMKASNDGLFDWNLVTNEIYYSPGWKRMLGYEEHELPNDFSIWETLTEAEDVRRSWEQQRMLINKEIDRFVMEFKMKHKNGHWIEVLSQAEAVFDSKGHAVRIVGTHSDITGRKHAEQKLRESEARYRLLHENAGLGIGYYTPDGRVISFNKVAARLMGGDPQQFFGKTMAELYGEKAAELYLNRLNTACKSDKENVYEDSVNLPSGDKYFLSTYTKIEDIDKNVLGVQIISQDITSQKQAELAIRNAKEKIAASEEMLKLVIKASNDAPWDWDLEKDELFYSPQWWAQLGYQPDELPKDAGLWSRLLHPDDHSKVDEVFNGALEQRYDSYALEFRLKHKLGHYVPILTKGFITYNDTGRPVRVTGTNIDLSKQKKAEQDLIAAKERAEESDRLKSAFLANMSHEIRTPMNGIMGFADLLKEPDLSGEQQQKFIGIIHKSGERMLRIINDIIDISKIEAGLMKTHMTNSNINEQIEFISTFFKPEAAAKKLSLSYRVSLPFQEAIVKTDREKVFAIFTNLVKNAIKYTEEGSIELGYDRISEQGNEYLRFYVQDTGIGIPADRQEAIFERFVQADIFDTMARQGAGLGLSITKSYVEMLGGRIWLQSEAAKGSTFYFTLPYVTQIPRSKDSKDDKMKNAAEAAKSIRPLKILVVEDDESSMLYFDITLQPYSSSILKANSGKQALSLVRKTPDIDLILMDVQLPEMNGHEATRQIRQFNKDVIIIAQTAFAQTVDRQRALDAGCNDYLSKPINKQHLRKLIQHYFAT